MFTCLKLLGFITPTSLFSSLLFLFLFCFVPCFLRARLYLHGVVGVLVVEHQRLLNELVVSLELIDVGFVGDDDVFALLQLSHLILQSPSYLQSAAANLLSEKHTVALKPD